MFFKHFSVGRKLWALVLGLTLALLVLMGGLLSHLLDLNDEAAHAAESAPADPRWFGPNAPRVKGGVLFRRNHSVRARSDFSVPFRVNERIDERREGRDKNRGDPDDGCMAEEDGKQCDHPGDEHIAPG